ncbi:MAG: site-specific integrase [Methyloligellaceae bacterium]
MKAHLTERYAKTAEGRPGRDTLIFDEGLAGFGLCVYASGRRAFVLIYRLNGRQRRYTIGSWPEWSVTAAREEAKALKRQIDRGDDPLGARQEAREAPTVSELIDRYIVEHTCNLSPRSASDQKSMLRKLVEPEWGSRKAAEITPADVERLLNKIAQGRARPHKAKPKGKRRKPLAPPKPTPVRANRVGEVLRKMFNLAVAWGIRPDNPAASFTRRVENEREVFLSLEEIDRLAKVFEDHPNKRAADIVRMLLLTGARLGEVRQARFEQFNLELAIWTKPAATTKQRKTHRLPLSPEAVEFVRMRRRAVDDPDCPWLFPGDAEGKPVQEIRRFWDDCRKRAELPNVRLHDLRHTFASLLVSGGMSLPMIGRLLGHTQAKTTQRYAHLMDDPLRQGVAAVGELLRPRLRVVHDSEAEDLNRQASAKL